MNEADMIKRYQDIINRDEILNENPTFSEITEDDLNPELTEASREKRYVVEFSMRMWDSDDEAIMAQAEKFVQELDHKFDNSPVLHSVYEQPFGTLGNREVFNRD
ncbi:MAG: hypothetical protein HOK52_06830 [Candidatus Marinimicrobia bacterium]|jgi:hypothetical protein|nr:hypothetical protein [Candidatus Neomarinimicrobiota bacterium]